MAKNLTQLTERTATADTDLMHINSSGTDYKETKLNFLKGNFWHEFDNTSLLTTQAENLPSAGTYLGFILSSGHQTETGVPYNASFGVKVIRYSSTYIAIELDGLSANPGNISYVIGRGSNGWGDWQQRMTNITGTSFKVFDNSSLLTAQVDNLPLNTAVNGYILSNGHQTETGVPQNAPFYVETIKGGTANSALIKLMTVSAAPREYYKQKYNGTWGNWILRDAKYSTVSTTPHTNITANRLTAYRVGDMVTVSFNMDTNADFATNANLIQLGVGTPALIDFPCMNVTDGTIFQLYMTAGGMVRNGATLASGKRLIGCFSYAADA